MTTKAVQSSDSDDAEFEASVARAKVKVSKKKKLKKKKKPANHDEELEDNEAPVKKSKKAKFKKSQQAQHVLKKLESGFDLVDEQADRQDMQKLQELLWANRDQIRRTLHWLSMKLASAQKVKDAVFSNAYTYSKQLSATFISKLLVMMNRQSFNMQGLKVIKKHDDGVNQLRRLMLWACNLAWNSKLLHKKEILFRTRAVVLHLLRPHRLKNVFIPAKPQELSWRGPGGADAEPGYYRLCFVDDWTQVNKKQGSEHIMNHVSLTLQDGAHWNSLLHCDWFVVPLGRDYQGQLTVRASIVQNWDMDKALVIEGRTSGPCREQFVLAGMDRVFVPVNLNDDRFSQLLQRTQDQINRYDEVLKSSCPNDALSFDELAAKETQTLIAIEDVVSVTAAPAKEAKAQKRAPEKQQVHHEDEPAKKKKGGKKKKKEERVEEPKALEGAPREEAPRRAMHNGHAEDTDETSIESGMYDETSDEAKDWERREMLGCVIDSTYTIPNPHDHVPHETEAEAPQQLAILDVPAKPRSKKRKSKKKDLGAEEQMKRARAAVLAGETECDGVSPEVMSMVKSFMKKTQIPADSDEEADQLAARAKAVSEAAKHGDAAAELQDALQVQAEEAPAAQEALQEALQLVEEAPPAAQEDVMPTSPPPPKALLMMNLGETIPEAPQLPEPAAGEEKKFETPVKKAAPKHHEGGKVGADDPKDILQATTAAAS